MSTVTRCCQAGHSTAEPCAPAGPDLDRDRCGHLRDTPPNLSWRSYRIEVDPTAIGVCLAAAVLPTVNEVTSAAPETRWWWLRKADESGVHIRLRLGLPVARALQLAEQARCRLASRQPGEVAMMPYEQERALFGGPVGMATVEEFFQLDSAFIAWWLARTPGSATIPEGISILALRRLMTAARLDSLDQWATWVKVAELRRLPPARMGDLRDTVARVRRLLDTHETSAIEGIDPAIASYAAAIWPTGQRLAEVEAGGQLRRTLRQILAPLVLFHWNRAGLPYLAQGRLAAAIVTASDPIPDDKAAGA